jgi:AraC-like DNA-binding protein
MPHTATALTSWAKAIRKALEAAGHDAKPLFAKAGLDMAALEDPNARYPVENTSRLWRLAVEATQNPAFGLAVAGQVTPTTFHALGYSLVASATLKDVFERLVRYFRIVSDAAELEFRRSGDEYHFLIHLDSAGPRPADEAIDAFMSVNLRMCRALYGRQLSPLKVRLRRSAPADVTAFARVFRAPLAFGADANLLAFDRAAFETPLEGANPELARHNDEIVLKYLAHFDRHNITNRVHGALVELLSLGEPSQEKIADTLHMSLRNLQRKLAAESTSYKEILNNTRRDLALSYMKDPKYTISEITYLLGFSDTSSFTRAFRRWTGKSPSAYRADPGSAAG